MLDVKALSDSELAQLYSEVVAETDRRQDQAVAEKAVIDAVHKLQEGLGINREQGAPYTQPQGAHDAYTLGDVVSYEGRRWKSLLAVNVWAPGVVAGGWEPVNTDPDDPEPEPVPVDDYPAWEPGIAVKPGELYAHQGGLYQTIQAHTTQPDWAPDLVPALWKKVK